MQTLTIFLTQPVISDYAFQIVQDFNIRHPNLALIVYERWPKASKLLFQYAEESGLNISKTLKVSKSSSALTDGKILRYVSIDI